MNKKVDKLMEEFEQRGKFVSISIEAPISYIAIKIDDLVGVGMMRCMPTDEFNCQLGFFGALRKALKDIYEQREKIRRCKRNKFPCADSLKALCVTHE